MRTTAEAASADVVPRVVVKALFPATKNRKRTYSVGSEVEEVSLYVRAGETNTSLP
jgi:hypothetical protein